MEITELTPLAVAAAIIASTFIFSGGRDVFPALGLIFATLIVVAL